MNPRNIRWLAAFFIASLLALSRSAWAEEASATLATLPQKLAALAKEYDAAVAAAQKILEDEIAAGRIKDPVAASLRWSLKSVAQNVTSYDSRSLVNTAKVPSDNETLRTSFTTLETAIAAISAQRVKAIKEAQADLKQRVSEVVRTAERADQIEPLQTQIETLREALSKTAGSSYGDGGQQVQNAQSLLTALQRVVAAEREGEQRNLGNALSSLQALAQNSQFRLAEGEIQARVEKATKPVVAAAEAAREALEKSLIDNRPIAETTAAFSRFEEASKRASGLRSRVDYNSRNEDTEALNMYRSILQAAAAAAKGDATTARREAGKAQSSLSLESANTAKLRTWFDQWKATLESSITAVQAQKVEKIRARLAAIKTAAELEEYAAELAAAGSVEESEEGMRDAWLSSFAQELSLLAAQWITGSVGEISSGRYSTSSGSNLRNRFSRELAALRKLAERESVSRTLRAPELLQAPLLEQPIGSAVESLCDDLAKRAEWRRLYRVLESYLSRFGGTRPPDPTLTALQSYFAGQNLELAEQWKDAVAAYKEVLKTVSERVPVKEVGERLKALKKDHPEAFNETTPAAKAP